MARFITNYKLYNRIFIWMKLGRELDKLIIFQNYTCKLASSQQIVFHAIIVLNPFSVYNRNSNYVGHY